MSPPVAVQPLDITELPDEELECVFAAGTALNDDGK